MSSAARSRLLLLTAPSGNVPVTSDEWWNPVDRSPRHLR